MFVLRRGLLSVDLDKNTKKVVGVETQNPQQKLKTSHLIIGSNNLLGTSIPWDLLGDTASSSSSSSSSSPSPLKDQEEKDKNVVSMAAETLRSICITDRTLMPDEKGTMFQLVIPPGRHNSNSTSVLVQQMDESLMVCPKGHFLLFFSVAAENEDADAETHLRPIVESLVRLQTPPLPHPQEPNEHRKESVDDDDAIGDPSSSSPSSSVEDQEKEREKEKEEESAKPIALWSCFYADGRLRDQNKIVDSFSRLETNIHVCKAISAFTMDHDESVIEARSLFERICPETPFLPAIEDSVYRYEKNWEDDTSSLDSATPHSDAPPSKEEVTPPEQKKEDEEEQCHVQQSQSEESSPSSLQEADQDANIISSDLKDSSS